MLYFVFNLGSYEGAVRLYHFTNEQLLLKARLECQAARLPEPQTFADAIEHLQQTAFQIEAFGSVETAEQWAATYTGFRAAEVRAELARYQRRHISANGDELAP